MMDLDGAHWRFAIDVYGKAGVSASCLYLQDNYGVDVNILLLSLYATRFLELTMSETRIKYLDDSARQLREVVICPLRKILRELKPIARDAESESLRALIQKVELFAEQYEQARLAEILIAWTDPQGKTDLELTGETAVRFYARECGEATIGPLAIRALGIIVQSVHCCASLT